MRGREAGAGEEVELESGRGVIHDAFVPLQLAGVGAVVTLAVVPVYAARDGFPGEVAGGVGVAKGYIFVDFGGVCWLQGLSFAEKCMTRQGVDQGERIRKSKSRA